MIVFIEEALDSPGNDRSLLRNNLSFLYRTVAFTQNTTIFFKEGWHNFKEIVKFYKEAMSLLGHRTFLVILQLRSGFVMYPWGSTSWSLESPDRNV